MSRFRVGDRFLLRIPLLPYEAIDAGSGALSEQRSHLSAIVERPDVSEAIVLASRSLHRRVATWRVAPDSDDGSKAELSLAKYITRMASSPIPFGALGGIATGDVDRHLEEQPAFQLGAPGAHARKTRVHGEVLHRLMTVLSQIPSVRRRTVFRTNTSASATAGSLRYLQANHRSDRQAPVEYALISVELTPDLQSVLEAAKPGARLDDLASALLRHDPDVKPAEVEAYVEELVDAQILVPELGLWSTGGDPMTGVARQLADAGLDEIAGLFERIREELGAIDAAGLGRPISSYSTVLELLRQLWRSTHAMAGVEDPASLDEGRLFHLDVKMATTERPRLGAAVIRDLEGTVGLLQQITRRREDPALSEFRDAFVERWGDRDVPLVEALDEGSGLGFPLPGREPPREDWSHRESELLSSPIEEQLGAARDARSAWLLALWKRACVEGQREVVVSPDELAALAHEIRGPREARLPDAFAVRFRLGVRGEERQLWLQRVSGPSGARSLGRLCHVDPDVEAMVREHLAGDAAGRSGAVLAEVVHLPDGRSADLLCRPAVLDHEIVYLGRGGVPPDRQIGVDDLMVTVRHGRVILRSRRLGCEVVPRLTSTYRLADSVFAVCRFLGALQAQDADSIGWSWGPLEKFSWLPRVRIGDVVVAREQWRLCDDEVMLLNQTWAEKDVVARRGRVFDAVAAMRAGRPLPRHLVLVDDDGDGDNGDLIDLEHHLRVQVLAGEVVLGGRRLLTEVYPAPSASIVRGPEGHHASELVVTFVREPDG